MSSPNTVRWIYGVMLKDAQARQVHENVCTMYFAIKELKWDDPFNHGIPQGPLAKIQSWLGLFGDGNYYGMEQEYCDVPTRDRQPGLDYAFGVEVKTAPGQPIPAQIINDANTLLLPYLQSLGIQGTVGIHRVEQYCS